MRIKGCRGSDAGTDGGKDRNRCDAPRACGGITVFGTHCNAVARQANETETFSPLLRHHDAVTTTNQVGIQEARPRNEPRVLDGGDANAFEQRAVALWYERIVW